MSKIIVVYKIILKDMRKGIFLNDTNLFDGSL